MVVDYNQLRLILIRRRAKYFVYGQFIETFVWANMFDYGRLHAHFTYMTVRVLLADDYKNWRDYVRSLLQTQPDWQVVCEVSDGLEAVQKAEELRPDLIVLDVGLPNLNGIEAARRIKQLSPDSRIVFLSTDNSLEVVRVAMSTGAQAFVYKARAQSDLLDAINAALRGKQLVSNMVKGYRFTDTAAAKAPHCHEVQFYSDDAVFLDGFARFITAALEAGDVAILVGTQSHRESIAERLKVQGVDIDAAIRQGTFIPVDVAQMLSTFMVNDMPDTDRFFEVVGPFLTAAAKAGKRDHPRIVVCGEAVSVLCAEGKSEAAIRVEQLWEQIATIYEIDIFCAYSLSNFHGKEDEHVFQSICAIHSAVYSQANS